MLFIKFRNLLLTMIIAFWDVTPCSFLIDIKVSEVLLSYILKDNIYLPEDSTKANSLRYEHLNSQVYSELLRAINTTSSSDLYVFQKGFRPDGING
jgi:hypothetical protein